MTRTTQEPPGRGPSQRQLRGGRRAPRRHLAAAPRAARGVAPRLAEAAARKEVGPLHLRRVVRCGVVC